MKTFALFLSMTTLPAFALTIQCESPEAKITISATSNSDIKATYRGESVFADGLVGPDEVDIVAKFSQHGEMTLFAKVGKVSPANYIFFKGKRSPVNCR